MPRLRLVRSIGVGKTIMDACRKTGSRVSTGVGYVDGLIGHLGSGDNVIWYDSSGSRNRPFSHRFLQSSYSLEKPVLYVTFDNSPSDLLSQLGPLANNPLLTIIDCFTWGKGEGAEVFLKFYYEDRTRYPGRIVRVDDPRRASLVSETLWGTYAALEGEVRFVFESLTGMQEQWKTEEAVLDFYSRTCPRLFELDTISYWIIKSGGESWAIRPQLNEIAQVVIDLTVRRGKDFLVPIKTGSRGTSNLGIPHQYWMEENAGVAFEGVGKSTNRIEFSRRLKEARKMRGMSQRELARQVGVTGGAISQTESNMILPSLSTLFKIAEALSVEPGFFFRESGNSKGPLVFSPSEGKEIALPQVPSGSAVAKTVIPMDENCNTEVYLMEIPPQSTISPHFLIHKGEEIGCLLSGRLQFDLGETLHKVTPGDVVHLTSDVPKEWRNPGSTTARLLWIKIK